MRMRTIIEKLPPLMQNADLLPAFDLVLLKTLSKASWFSVKMLHLKFRYEISFGIVLSYLFCLSVSMNVNVFHSWNWLKLGVFKLFFVLIPVDRFIKKKCYLLLLKFSDFFAWWIFDNTACKVHGHVFMFVSQFSFQISHFKKQRALLGIMKLFLASLSTFLLIIVTDGWEIWFFSIFTLLF